MRAAPWRPGRARRSRRSRASVDRRGRGGQGMGPPPSARCRRNPDDRPRARPRRHRLLGAGPAMPPTAPRAWRTRPARR
ncbi:MAG: hypothetical protein MZW92_28525 [Comamonadaceae bacterium]|nr:hypothetical protein [Comamonadaceae bacterium]